MVAIRTIADWQALNDEGDYGPEGYGLYGHYTLENDLTFNETDILPIYGNTLYGSFDGRGHTITVRGKAVYPNGQTLCIINTVRGSFRNLNIVYESITHAPTSNPFGPRFYGLAVDMSNSIVENISIHYENISLPGDYEAQLFVSNMGYCTMRDITITGKVTLGGTQSSIRGMGSNLYYASLTRLRMDLELSANGVSGIGSGYEATMTDCYIKGKFFGVEYVEGLDNNGYRCTYTDVTTDLDLRGFGEIKGWTNGYESTYTRCRAHGQIVSTVVGRVGDGPNISAFGSNQFNCTFYDCYVDMYLEGDNAIGGFTQYGSESRFINCEFAGIINGTSRTDLNEYSSSKDISGIANYGAYFENCKMSGSISAYGYVAGISVRPNNLTRTRIVDCHVTGTITGNPNGAKSDYVGGISAYFLNGTIEQCSVAATATIKGGKATGGIVAHTNSEYGRIRNSYCAADLRESDYSGGIVGAAGGVAIDNCHFVGQASGFSRGLVGRDTTDIYVEGETLVTNSYYRTGSIVGTPSIPAGEEKTGAEFILEETFSGWNFRSIWELVQDVGYPTLQTNPGTPGLFAGGSGTEEDPWLVETFKHLENVRLQNALFDREGQMSHYKQIANIDASAIDHNWKSWSDALDLGTSKPFVGHYDGNGFSINGLYQFREGQGTDRRNDSGLVGVLGVGSLRNITMTNAYTGTSIDGAFSCLLLTFGEGEIANCQVQGTVEGYYAAGFCASTSGLTITGCSSDATIRAVWAGGFSVWAATAFGESAPVSDCFAVGDIYAPPGFVPREPTEWLHMGMFTANSIYDGVIESYQRCYSAVRIHPDPHAMDEFHWPQYESWLWGSSGSGAYSLNNCYMDLQYGGPQATWSVTKSYYAGRFVRGRDGQLYECIENQLNTLFGVNAVPNYPAEPGVGAAWREYWRLVTQTTYPNSRNTAQMKREATFIGWNFVDIWTIAEDITYPTFVYGKMPDYLEFQFRDRAEDDPFVYVNAGQSALFDVYAIFINEDNSITRENVTPRAKLVLDAFSQDGVPQAIVNPDLLFEIFDISANSRVFSSYTYGTLSMRVQLGNVEAPIEVEMQAPFGLEFYEILNGGVRREVSNLTVIAGTVKRLFTRAIYPDGFIYEATYDAQWLIENQLGEDNLPAEVAELSQGSLLRTRGLGTADVVARFQGAEGTIPLLVGALLPVFERVVAEASEVVAIFKIPVTSRNRAYFRLSAYSDQAGNNLITRYDSVGEPEKFLLSSNNGLSWQPVSEGGITLDNADALYRCDIPVGPRNNFWLSVGATVEVGEEEDIDINPPIISLDKASGTYNDQVLYVTVTTDEPAVVKYSLDGRDPTEASPVYTQAIAISSNTTLKLFATDILGNRSEVVSETYTFDRQPPVLSASRPSGTLYAGSGGTVDITFEADEPAVIYYTDDATDPIVGESPIYEGQVLQLTEGMEVVYKLIAVDTAGNISPIFRRDYVILGTPPGASFADAIEVTPGTSEEPNYVTTEVVDDTLAGGVYYHLTDLEIGTTYQIVVRSTNNFNDVQLDLYDSSNTLLLYVDRNGDGGESYSLEAFATELYVKVRAYGSNSRLEPTVITISNTEVVLYRVTSFSDPFQAGDVSDLLGTAVRYELHPYASNCWVRFTGLTAGTYEVETSEYPAAPYVDTMLYVYSSSQGQLAYDDDGGSGTFSKASFTAPADGVAVVRATAFGSVNEQQPFYLTIRKR